jgi:molybdopterin converting factor small subunit
MYFPNCTAHTKGNALTLGGPQRQQPSPVQVEIMVISVKSIGAFREQFGSGVTVELSHPPYTAGQLLHLLQQRYGLDFARQVLPADGQENVMALLVDGRNITSQQGLDTPLQEGAEVYFAVMVAGG